MARRLQSNLAMEIERVLRELLGEDVEVVGLADVGGAPSLDSPEELILEAAPTVEVDTSPEWSPVEFGRDELVQWWGN